MKTQRHNMLYRDAEAPTLLLCAPLRTAGFSARGCACCFCYPTGRSGPSTSRRPPGWGETLQSRRTSPLTAAAEELFVRCASQTGAVLLLFSPYLAVEDVLGRPLLVLHVPDQSHTVGLVRSVLVVVVRGHQELWILRRDTAASWKGSGEAAGWKKKGEDDERSTCGDQSRQVTTLFFVQCSSENCLFCTSFAPACKSLGGKSKCLKIYQ